MNIITYHIDTFTDRIFSGNQAAVCNLEKWLDESVMQKIAEENNLAATAFIVREGDKYGIRWFAPEYEIDLCGHGSLAAGYVIFNILDPGTHEITFNHHKAGILRVNRKNDYIVLDFPAKAITPCAAPDALAKGLGAEPVEVYEFRNERILAIFESEEAVRKLTPDMSKLKHTGHRGVVVSAPGKTVDFVSRVFYPNKSISEDAVTGSAFCLLAPYWSRRLNKTEFRALQVSPRGGEVICALDHDRVYIHGKAVIFKKGEITGL